jgi:hypothetical protein
MTDPLKVLCGVNQLFVTENTCHYSMESELSIEAPICQASSAILRDEWICEAAIVCEECYPLLGSGQIYHAHVQDVCVLIKDIRDLLVFE